MQKNSKVFSGESDCYGHKKETEFTHTKAIDANTKLQLDTSSYISIINTDIGGWGD